MDPKFLKLSQRLNAEPPATTTGLIRSLLPLIDEQRNRQGKNLKQIWKLLKDEGTLSCSYEAFHAALTRARKIQRKLEAISARESLPKPRAQPPKVSSVTFQGSGPRSLKPSITRPGFHYRGTESLDELVHGKKPEK